MVSAHRSYAHYLAGSLEKMLGELFGKVVGCARGKGGSMHLIDLEVNVTAAVPIVGSSISIGTGIGLGLKQQQSPNIVVVYFGDGATEEGVFSESVDFTVLMDLPVMFVCEIIFILSTLLFMLVKVRIADCRKFVTVMNRKSFYGDGNNVEDVLKITEQAREYMTANKNPVLLEFDTYRWLEHCGPNWDDHLGYRQDRERSMDVTLSNEKIKKYLNDNGVSPSDLASIDGDIDEKIDQAFFLLAKVIFQNFQNCTNMFMRVEL